jgi:hypothetical protein
MVRLATKSMTPTSAWLRTGMCDRICAIRYMALQEAI